MSYDAIYHGGWDYMLTQAHDYSLKSYKILNFELIFEIYDIEICGKTLWIFEIRSITKKLWAIKSHAFFTSSFVSYP